MMVWPHHCLKHHEGHRIFPELQQALIEWERFTGKFVRYELKGQYRLTDMYSVFRPIAYVSKEFDDRGFEQGKYTETRLGNTVRWKPFTRDSESAFNSNLYDELMRCSEIVVGGEAESHCVNHSVRHLVDQMKRDGVRDCTVTVLEDATSPVTGYDQAAAKFKADMRVEGVQFEKADVYAKTHFEVTETVEVD